MRSFHQCCGARRTPSPTPTRSPSKALPASISRSSIATGSDSASAIGAAVCCARSSGLDTRCVTSLPANHFAAVAGHRLAGVGQPEPGQPAVEDLVGVVHLAVPEQVHDASARSRAATSAAARAAAGSAASTRSSASPESAALTNQASNADGGR